MGEKNNKKNFFLYLIEFFRKHKAEETYIATFVKKDISEQNLNAIANIFLICVLVYVIMEIVEIFRLIINIRGKEIKFLSLIELVMSSGILTVLTSLGLDSSWSEKGVSVFPLYILLYLLGMPIWICIRLLIHKAVEEWEESSEQIIENEKRRNIINKNVRDDYIFRENIQIFFIIFYGRILNIIGEILLFYFLLLYFLLCFCLLDLL